LDYELVATIHTSQHPFDPNGTAALLTFKRLRIGQPHEAAAGRARYKLIGADRSYAHGFGLTTRAQSGA
jgi:hypothetical protein